MPSFDPTLPAAVPASEAVLQMVLSGLYAGQAVINTFYYQATVESAKVDNDAMAAAGTAWKSLILGPMTDAVSDKVVFDTITVHNLTSPGYAGATVAIAAADGEGNRIGEALPPQNAICMSRKTGIVGRHGRGSIRIAGISESDQVNGVVTAAGLITALNVLRDTKLMDTFQSMVDGVLRTWTPVLARAVSSIPVLVEYAVIRSWKYHVNISSQNSRKLPHAGA